MTVMFGGEVAYLCWAINEPFVNEVSFPEKIRPASETISIFQNPFRSSCPKLSSPDRPVPSALPVFRRGDVFRTKNKRLPNRSRGQCRSGGGEKPYALAH